MNWSETPSEQLRRVTIASLKAIGQNPEVEVTYSTSCEAQVATNGATVRLPAPKETNITEHDVNQLRGSADAVALRIRYHDNIVHSRLRPSGSDAALVFERAEQVRVESIGCIQLPGVEKNITAMLKARCLANAPDPTKNSETNDIKFLAEAMGLMIHQKLTGRELPASAEPILRSWGGYIVEHVGHQLDGLEQKIHNQEEFASSLSQMIKKLDLFDEGDVEPDEVPKENNDQSENISEKQELENEQTESQQSVTEQGQDEITDIGLDTMSNSDENDQIDGDDPAGPGKENENWLDNKPNNNHYFAYSTDADEVVSAEDLCEADELNRLRTQLDQQLIRIQGAVSRLANRLQRRLMAKQIRSWDFDQEEGLLDAGRLSRVVTDPVHPLSFKQERDTDFRDTVVSLLIDNSGSMRGRPITVAAMSADILARTLERCGVKVEILGFTTRAWKGGQAREKWVENGKPSEPGRLNDLRHIIYKDADMPWRRARRNLGLMLREGLLKENIDGESLLWAHNRLMGRPEQRRILLVISDGAPVDDSTLSTNPGNYLEKHLRDVINWIENSSNIELTAIGIGHDVTRYYKRAVTISDAEELGGTMMQNLTDLFDENNNSFIATSGKTKLIT